MPLGRGDGVTGEPDKGDGSCNAVFPKLAHIPARNKDLVLTRSDTHGDPDLSSEHGVCAGKAGSADAYDWNSCWKVWDALRTCATPAATAATPWATRASTARGLWSDGTPVAPSKIQDAAPIRP